MKRTSQGWHIKAQEETTTIIIYDPDGWDRTNFDYSFFEEYITAKEFEKRMINSTIMFGKHERTRD
ncbi:hypothetical protein FOF46_01380 [Aquimarina algiphila]|uniref:Uncharacterized protein n=1 Tax=Aquimarina algiphila TaxID=2047982 RepID=A0A554VRU8_9FLAO|nr:hypothetical protein FOF46_01380 [Aquimarina algiphila]